MNLNDLKLQVALGEDSRRQFKRDVTNVDSLAAEMAAFVNSEGGVIYLGVADGGHLPNNLTVAKIRAGNSSIRNPSWCPTSPRDCCPIEASVLASSGRWRTGRLSTLPTTAMRTCSPQWFTEKSWLMKRSKRVTRKRWEKRLTGFCCCSRRIRI